MRRFLSFFFVGLAAGALAATLTVVVLHRPKARRIEAYWKGVPVLVMTRDVPDGALIDDSALAERGVPAEYLTESFVRSEDRALVVGKHVEHFLQKGDPLLWPNFASRPGWKDVLACAAAIKPALEESSQKPLVQPTPPQSPQDRDAAANELATRFFAERKGR